MYCQLHFICIYVCYVENKGYLLTYLLTYWNMPSKASRFVSSKWCAVFRFGKRSSSMSSCVREWAWSSSVLVAAAKQRCGRISRVRSLKAAKLSRLTSWIPKLCQELRWALYFNLWLSADLYRLKNWSRAIRLVFLVLLWGITSTEFVWTISRVLLS